MLHQLPRQENPCQMLPVLLLRMTAYLVSQLIETFVQCEHGSM